MYGIDPFSAQHATGDANHANAPSIFGALPYPGSTSTSVGVPLHTLVTFRFAPSSSERPSVLDCSVVGPNNETVYRLASTTTTDATSARGSVTVTMLQAARAAGRTIALVEWRSHPTVEVQGVVVKQPVGQWLRLSSDRRSRTMTHGGVHYSWVPVDRFLLLFAPGSSEWLARITKHYDTVVLEMTPRAVQLGLIDVAVLATTLLQSGRNVD